MTLKGRDDHDWNRGILFGIPIWSNFPFIINLPVCSRASELRISLGHSADQLAERGELICDTGEMGESGALRVRAFRNARSYQLWIAGVGCYVIDPTAIRCFPAVPDSYLLEVHLLGAALSFWLELTGRIALHAASLSLRKQAILLVGNNGSGKTTLTLECMRQGHPLLSDDISRLSSENGPWSIAPSYPQMRLWPEAATRMGLDPGQLDVVLPGLEKRRVPVGDDIGFGHFYAQEAPLLAGFFLSRQGPDSELSFQRIPPGEAIFLLIKNSFLTRLPRKAGLEASRFHGLSDLVQKVPFFELSYPTGFDQLERVFLELDRKATDLLGGAS